MNFLAKLIYILKYISLLYIYQHGDIFSKLSKIILPNVQFFFQDNQPPQIAQECLCFSNELCMSWEISQSQTNQNGWFPTYILGLPISQLSYSYNQRRGYLIKVFGRICVFRGKERHPKQSLSHHITPHFSLPYTCLVSPSLGEKWGGRGERHHHSWAFSTLSFHKFRGAGQTVMLVLGR